MMGCLEVFFMHVGMWYFSNETKESWYFDKNKNQISDFTLELHIVYLVYSSSLHKKKRARAFHDNIYSGKYDYIGYTHGQQLGVGPECEYSHVWELQGERERSPYKGSNRQKSKERNPSQNRELPSVPDITRTDRIYELTLSGKGIPGGNVIAAMNAQEGESQCRPPSSHSGGYSRRFGGPVYFELESQKQFGSSNCSVWRWSVSCR